VKYLKRTPTKQKAFDGENTRKLPECMQMHLLHQQPSKDIKNN